MNAGSAIRGFVSSPFAIEMPSARSALAAAAVLVLAAQGPSFAAQPRALSDTLATFQSKADAAFGRGRVVFLDATATSPVQLTKLVQSGIAPRDASALAGRTGEAESFDLTSAAGKPVCVVAAERPGRTAETMLSSEAGEVTAAGDARPSEVQSYTVALLAAACATELTPPERAAFAALAAVQSGAGHDLLPIVAARDELREWVEGSEPTSSATAAVAASSGSLRGDRTFASAGWKDLILRAKAVARASAPDRNMATAMATFGERVRPLIERGGVFAVPVKEGVVGTDFRGWLRANRSAAPLGRLAALADRLEGRPAPLPAAGAAVPSASDLLASASGKADSRAHLAGATDVPGTLIRFDRSRETFILAKDGERFVIRDTVTGKNRAVGNLRTGDVADAPAPKSPSP